MNFPGGGDPNYVSESNMGRLGGKRKMVEILGIKGSDKLAFTKFHSFFLFEGKIKSTFPSIHWFPLQMTTRARFRPAEVRGLQPHPGLSCGWQTAFKGAVAESWIRSRTPRTWTGHSNMKFYHCKQWIILLRYNVDTSQISDLWCGMNNVEYPKALRILKVDVHGNRI